MRGKRRAIGYLASRRNAAAKRPKAPKKVNSPLRSTSVRAAQYHGTARAGIRARPRSRTAKPLETNKKATAVADAGVSGLASPGGTPGRPLRAAICLLRAASRAALTRSSRRRAARARASAARALAARARAAAARRLAAVLSALGAPAAGGGAGCGCAGRGDAGGCGCAGRDAAGGCGDAGAWGGRGFGGGSGRSPAAAEPAPASPRTAASRQIRTLLIGITGRGESSDPTDLMIAPVAVFYKFDEVDIEILQLVGICSGSRLQRRPPVPCSPGGNLPVPSNSLHRGALHPSPSAGTRRCPGEPPGSPVPPPLVRAALRAARTDAKRWAVKDSNLRPWD